MVKHFQNHLPYNDEEYMVIISEAPGEPITELRMPYIPNAIE